MARVRIDGSDLVVEVEGLDRLWALKSRITIPLAHVRGATHDPGIVRDPKGIRAPGTHLPGVLVAGTYHRDGDKVFWDVHDPSDAVVIELSDEEYTRLVIGVPDAPAVVAAVESALRAG